MPKKKSLQLKRKRMKGSARLQYAKNWIPTYTGSNPVKGYRKWLGVDLLCAIRESLNSYMKVEYFVRMNVINSLFNMKI